MLRMTATRGMEKMGWPPASSDHVCMNCSSEAPAIALRDAATFLSNNAIRSAFDLTTGGWYGGAPTGATSNEFFWIVSVAQPVMDATCVASVTISQDLG